MKRHRDREIAVSTLYSLDFNGNLSSDAEFDPYQGMNEEEVSSLGEDDKVFIRFLVYGTLENLEAIDALISKYSLNRPIETTDLSRRSILLTGTFSVWLSISWHSPVTSIRQSSSMRL